MVRSVKQGNSWHPATDLLRGTDEYQIDDATWSIKFDDRDFSEFLFMTGDCEKWLIAAKEEVYGWYQNEDRNIKISSTNKHSNKAKWYRRDANKEDPWISLNDHHDAIV